MTTPRRVDIMRRFLFVTGLLVLLVVAPALVGLATPPVSLTTWTSYDVGSAGYMQSAFLAEALMEKYKIRVRIVPASVAVTRHMPVRAGEVDVAFTGVDAWFMQEGLMEYSELAWGPQAIRVLWFSHPGGLALAVRADSNIRTVADLKGKRVAVYPGAEVLDLYTRSILAFGGLTYEDVQTTRVPGYTAAQDMVMKGTLDVALIAVQAPKAYEWAALPGGIRFLPTPTADREGWKRLNAIFPAYAPYTATSGPGVSPDNPLETGVASSPRMMTYNRLSDETAYFLTKAVHETRPLYAPKHASMREFWTLETNLALFKGDATPFHAGAVRYFKEIGAWTPELERVNQARLERQEKLRAAWDAAVNEARDQKIREAAFSPFWLQKRTEAGF
jgi:uncharacterized protein